MRKSSILILFSKVFNLRVSIFSLGAIDVYRPRGTLSNFPWNSLSLCSIFVHCGRLLETRTFIEFVPKHSDMMANEASKQQRINKARKKEKHCYS